MAQLGKVSEPPPSGSWLATTRILSFFAQALEPLDGVLSFLKRDNLTDNFNSIEGSDRRDRERRLDLCLGF